MVKETLTDVGTVGCLVDRQLYLVVLRTITNYLTKVPVLIQLYQIVIPKNVQIEQNLIFCEETLTIRGQGSGVRGQGVRGQRQYGVRG